MSATSTAKITETTSAKIVVEPEEIARVDLIVASIGVPSVSCPGGPGTRIHTVEILVENIGDGAAPAFTLRARFDPA